MDVIRSIASLKTDFIKATHSDSDYFSFIKGCLKLRQQLQKNCPDFSEVNKEIAACYSLLHDEIKNNDSRPLHLVSFGTSGWRGILGKDLFVKSVQQVTLSIVELYKNVDKADRSLKEALGVSSLEEARKRGCVVGYDNRFGGETLALGVNDVLSANGFAVHYAAEATTGTLSASVLELHAAFSINLTPSHNPLEYGGFKYNAADAGPASSLITDLITENARKNIELDLLPALPADRGHVHPVHALSLWKNLVRKNQERHGLDYDDIMKTFGHRKDVAVAVDCVHGASRVHMHDLFNRPPSGRFLILRGEADPTFGGISPEPSSSNLKMVKEMLASRQEPLKLGMIMDPDADRIRFVDPTMEISMNQFGAMAYHYLHEIKGKNGILAKTVATSNFGNAIAKALHEEIFEPPVGFKEFKPVVGKALVFFEESDGISITGHTPEKDAYIGLLLALDMIMTLNKNLSLYLKELEDKYGAYFPDRGGEKVSIHGPELAARLGSLKHFHAGKSIEIDGQPKTVKELITIDGYKIIFEDNSWLMIRPSGTEPKVRFYVEARTEKDKKGLLKAAAQLLKDMELLD